MGRNRKIKEMAYQSERKYPHTNNSEEQPLPPYELTGSPVPKYHSAAPPAPGAECTNWMV